jgi:N-acyl-D-amino-acid deacylase
MSADALRAGIPWTFETFPEYLDAVARTRPKLKVAVTLGHTPRRLYVLGKEAADREAAEAEIGHMCKIVCEAMDAGAIGFASFRQPAHAGAGGKPVPSRLATMEELFALAEPLAERSRGIFAIARRSDFDAQEIAELSAGAAGRLDGAERQAPRAGRLIRDGGASAGPVG